MKPLKPVMAAFLAASSFAFALPRTAVADEPALSSEDVARAKALAHDKEFVAHLISLVDAKPEVRADIGARLARFIQSRDKGKQYLTDGLLNDKLQLKGALGEAKKWPETNKGESGKVAELYYVIGMDADKVPAWAPAGFDDEFKANPQWSHRLTDYLVGDGWSTTRQVAQSASANSTTALLDVAAKWAHKILEDARTASEIHESIVSNDTTGSHPPTTTGSTSSPLDTTGSGFGFDDLYVKGAKTGDVYGPKDDGYRTLSMKVYTTMIDGKPVNRVGVVDITKDDPNSPSAPKFVDVTHVGDSEIVMREGGRHYTVSVDEKGNVTLKRSGAKDGDGGGSIGSTVAGLAELRNNQIMKSGTVTIGGQTYYVLGQGGLKGSFLFFSQADLLASPKVNAHPELMGDVAEVDDDGGTLPIKGHPDLGTLRSGDPYHLEFNPTKRLWEVVKGQGDVKADKKSKDATDTKDASGKPTTATAGDQADATDTGATLDDAVKLAVQPKDDPKQVWTEEADSFDAATHAQARIMSNQQDGAKHFEVLFDPKFGVKGGAWAVSLVDPKTNAPLAVNGVRGMGKYIGLEFKASTVYYDVANLAKFAIGKKGDAAEPAGSYQLNNAVMANVKSVDIMEDILIHYMGAKKGDKTIATIRQRVAAFVKRFPDGSDYLINGNLKVNPLAVSVGGDYHIVWPDDKDSEDTGTNAGMTGLAGPGTVVAVAAGDNAPYQDMQLGQGRVATFVKTENHAGMFYSTEDQDDGKPAKVWSIMIEYKKNGLDSRSVRVPLTMFVGMDALPAYHMQGLVGVEVGQNPALGMLNGSDKKNGAIAMYKNAIPDAQGGQNLKDKVGNCLGAVLAWGNVTLEKADKACKDDSKL